MSNTSRVLAVVTAIVLTLSHSVHAVTTKTDVILFSAWSGDAFRHDLTVSAKIVGFCWIHSLASDRPDAWRCMARNDIHDPCFSGSSDPNKVACVEGPFSKDVDLMALTKPLPSAGGEMKLTGKLARVRLAGEPWGLRLADGETCEYVSGATEVVDGVRLSYGCTHGSVFGVPDRSSAIWSVFHVNAHRKQVAVVTAVF
jgi:hypothetical protein